jgi:hypothetical protein
MRLWSYLFLSLLLFVPACTSGQVDPGVPRGASLVTEMTGPAGSRSDRYTPLEADAAGAIYVFDAARKTLAYSGAVEAGQQIRLYPGGVAVVSQLGRARTPYEHWVTRFEPGTTYRIYYHPGAMPVNPTSDQGSPLTRPFEERTREVRPPGLPEPR